MTNETAGEYETAVELVFGPTMQRDAAASALDMVTVVAALVAALGVEAGVVALETKLAAVTMILPRFLAV